MTGKPADTSESGPIEAPNPLSVRVRVRIPVVLAMETAEGARTLDISISRYLAEWLKLLHEPGHGSMTMNEARAEIFRRVAGGNGHA